MIRLSYVRPVLLLCALSLTLSVAGCGAGGENARSTNAPSNTTSATNNQASSNAGGATNNQAANNTNRAKLNLNTASENEFLTAVPGLGKRMAHEFEEYRPYKSIQQFRREMGKYVKPEQIAEYEKYGFVPIVPNESDAATLQQIPVLDATEAQALIAARPFASNDAFLSKLAASVSEAEMAAAKTYLSNQ